MYFKNRAEAGKKLAAKLEGYANQNIIVVALGEAATVVAAQIALKLHATLTLLPVEQINLPGEPDPLAGVTSEDTFTYNTQFSEGQLEDFKGEFHNYIDQQRMEKIHKLNSLVGKGGEIDRGLLKNHVVILVSDGLSSPFALDVALDFLKPVKVKKLVIATPLASVAVVDRMHLTADEVHCLAVPENYISTEHHYDDNNFPSHEEAIKIIENNPLYWHHKA